MGPSLYRYIKKLPLPAPCRSKLHPAVALWWGPSPKRLNFSLSRERVAPLLQLPVHPDAPGQHRPICAAGPMQIGLCCRDASTRTQPRAASRISYRFLSCYLFFLLRCLRCLLLRQEGPRRGDRRAPPRRARIQGAGLARLGRPGPRAASKSLSMTRRAAPRRGTHTRR